LQGLVFTYSCAIIIEEETETQRSYLFKVTQFERARACYRS
jgi:hypothetical protein